MAHVDDKIEDLRLQCEECNWGVSVEWGESNPTDRLHDHEHNRFILEAA